MGKLSHAVTSVWVSHFPLVDHAVVFRHYRWLAIRTPAPVARTSTKVLLLLSQVVQQKDFWFVSDPSANNVQQWWNG